jgi:hypothetical protein
MLPAKFGSIWPSSFREDLFNISQSETRIALGGHICWRNGVVKYKLHTREWLVYYQGAENGYCQNESNL